MSLPKRKNQHMTLPLNRVARSYEAPIGQAIGAIASLETPGCGAQRLSFG